MFFWNEVKGCQEFNHLKYGLPRPHPIPDPPFSDSHLDMERKIDLYPSSGLSKTLIYYLETLNMKSKHDPWSLSAQTREAIHIGPYSPRSALSDSDHAGALGAYVGRHQVRPAHSLYPALP